MTVIPYVQVKILFVIFSVEKECVCVCVFLFFIKLHITVQSGPVLLVIPCYLYSSYLCPCVCVCVCVCVFCISLTSDRPQRATATLPSFLPVLMITINEDLTTFPRFSPYEFLSRSTLSTLNKLVNQSLNLTYSRSRDFRNSGYARFGYH